MTIMQPLADRARPENLDQIVGQSHLLNHQNGSLYKLVQNKQAGSLIFYGPPGTGKTTTAKVIAHIWQLPVEYFNAAIDNKAALQKIVKNHPDETVAVILDEIHRLTKPIQDFLLPYLESGQLLILGATTENPQITINPAIRSRCLMFEFKPVTDHEIALALQRVYGLFKDKQTPDPEIFEQIANTANGDVRTAINILESLYHIQGAHITTAKIKEYAAENQFAFDKDSNFHYDTISALQKSIRGWDTDAALYYTAVMCQAGDLETLIRRLKVITYEDIGLGDPITAQQAATALETSEKLGLPEAEIPIANAVILLCNAKYHSNSANEAIHLAMDDAKNNQAHSIPYHLRDTHYSGADKLGHTGYKYPHDYPNDWVNQQYLPEDLLQTRYYYPKDNPTEQSISKKYFGFKKLQQKK